MSDDPYDERHPSRSHSRSAQRRRRALVAAGIVGIVALVGIVVAVIRFLQMT